MGSAWPGPMESDAPFMVPARPVPMDRLSQWHLDCPLDRLCKLDMERHCKGILHGTDGRLELHVQAPEVAPASSSSRARFSSHSCHGKVSHLEGIVKLKWHGHVNLNDDKYQPGQNNIRRYTGRGMHMQWGERTVNHDLIRTRSFRLQLDDYENSQQEAPRCQQLLV